MGAAGSGADGSFEPYRDLPLGGDGTAVGGGSVEGQGVNRDGTGGGLPTGSGGSDGFSPFNSLGAAVASGGASDTNPRVTQGNNGPGLARSDGPNLVPGLNQQDSYGSHQDTPGGQQSAPGGDTGYNPPDPFDDLSHTSPSYTESTGASGDTSGGGSGQTGGDIASPNPHSAQSDLPLPRPPYWSWDAEPAIPAYTSAPSGTIAPGDAGMSSTVPYADHHADQMFLTSQANDLNINTSTAIVDVEAPDLPKGLHLGLERMGSPVARSRASSISHGASPFYKAGGVGPTVRPLNVRKSGGPRPQPSTSARNEDLAQGSQGRFSVPPAYDERHEI
ncbi:hypothetical protein BDV93DRAFT_525078 [Ceratobasidium sp. AG-I]|nr:hypothetical protein BDV93DRAFT_525078 [Ceratobasidium sp. AG-I]